MKYIDEFRNKKIAQNIVGEIKRISSATYYRYRDEEDIERRNYAQKIVEIKDSSS